MEFSFDISQTPLIGRRILLKSDSAAVGPASRHMAMSASAISTTTHDSPHTIASAVGPLGSPRRSASLSPADTVQLSGWKRPWMSQGRVRECLVSLLTTCGQRVGLPKSPSVSQEREKDRRAFNVVGMRITRYWLSMCVYYILHINTFYLTHYIIIPPPINNPQ